MELKHRIEQDLRDSMRRKETLRLSVLRLLSSAIHNREIEKKGKTGGSELTEEETGAVLRSEVKKRKDAIEEFTKGGRQDLAGKEGAELKILEEYLPEELPDEDIKRIVSEVVSGTGEATQNNFGRIMGEVMKRLKGQASGERVSAAVKRALGV